MTKLPDIPRHPAWASSVVGWGLIFVAACFLPEYIAAIFNPPVLRLDACGISVKGALFPERRTQWKDVTEIYLHTGRGPKRVRWKYDQSGVPKGRVKLDSTLSDSWSESPEAIIALMKRLWDD